MLKISFTISGHLRKFRGSMEKREMNKMENAKEERWWLRKQ